MHEIDRGFRLDGRLIAWGTTLASAAEAAGAAFADDGTVGYRRLRVRCRRAYGFDTLAAEMAAHGGDRPVTSLAYELALPGDGSVDSSIWTGPIGHALGAPVEQGEEDVSPWPDPSGSVRFHARWQGAEAAFGLSVYGGPRAIPEGRSAGMLWLSWPHARAAGPYLASWRAANAALEVAARGADEPQVFTLQAPQNPAFGGRGFDRAAELALMSPDVLDTPLAIAARLTPRQIALWRNREMKLCCISSRFDSMMWDESGTMKVLWRETKPAKGGGQSALEFGRWSVYDHFGHRTIAEAAAALAKLPGVTVTAHEDYDC